MKIKDIDRATAISHGYDAGDYAQAYVSEDLDRALQRQDPDLASLEPWCSAFIVGFFATYELNEIPGYYIEQFLESVANVGDDLVAAGIASYHELADYIDDAPTTPWARLPDGCEP